MFRNVLALGSAIRNFNMNAAEFFQLKKISKNLSPSDLAWAELLIWEELSDWKNDLTTMLYFCELSDQSENTAHILSRRFIGVSWTEESIKKAASLFTLNFWTDELLQSVGQLTSPILNKYLTSEDGYLKENKLKLLISNEKGDARSARKRLDLFLKNKKTETSNNYVVMLEDWLSKVDWSKDSLFSNLDSIEEVTSGKLFTENYPSELFIQKISPFLIEEGHNIEAWLVSCLTKLEKKDACQVAALSTKLANSGGYAWSLSYIDILKSADVFSWHAWVGVAQYSVSIRCEWLVEGLTNAYTRPDVVARLVKPLMDNAEPELKTVMALWCALKARKSDYKKYWKDLLGRDLSTPTGLKLFLRDNAPGLTGLIPLIETMELTFADALTMLASKDTENKDKRCLELPVIYD